MGAESDTIGLDDVGEIVISSGFGIVQIDITAYGEQTFVLRLSPDKAVDLGSIIAAKGAAIRQPQH